MLNFLFHTDNLPFTIALMVLVILMLIEVVGLLSGLHVSEAVDNMIPDIGVDGAGIDGPDHLDGEGSIEGAGADAPYAILRALTWLGLGKVPVIIFIGLFLAVFGMIGLAGQFIIMKITGGNFMIPGWIAWAPAMAAAIPPVRLCCSAVGRVFPKVQTTAVSEATFIGRVAIVTQGRARRGSPSQARLRDQHGQVHYLLVEPDQEDETFDTGCEVLLVKRHGAVFQAIRNTSAAMVD